MSELAVSKDTVWQSFDGRRFNNFEGMTHQHLSNVYYWTHVVNPDWYEEDVKKKIKTSIDRLYDGDIRPYRPLACFNLEMRTLRERGWLINHDNMTKVVINGEEIGWVDYNTYPI